MTLDEILAMHIDPTAHTMTYEVWQDGEITSTKAGPIFRHRGLHSVERATGDDVIDVTLMPLRLGKNGSIAVQTYDEAMMIRRWITRTRERRILHLGPDGRDIDPNAWAFNNGLDSF